MKFTIFAILLIGVVHLAAGSMLASMCNPIEWLPAWFKEALQSAKAGAGAATSATGNAGATNDGGGASKVAPAAPIAPVASGVAPPK